MEVIKIRQFIIFAIVGASTGILDLIDSAFANNIDIDSICVMSSFAILIWLINAVCRLGTYGYTVKQRYESECFILQIVPSIVIGILLILFRNHIPHLYALTSNQYELFSNCLLYEGIFLVFPTTEYFFNKYLQLKCRNKDIIISNIVLYGSMILLDALVIYMKGNCYHLVITTGLANMITLIYYLTFCKLYEIFNKPHFDKIIECLKSGKDILIDRIFGKITVVTCNILATHLGTELYAIHSVCYSIVCGAEEVTNALYLNQVTKLKKFTDFKEKYKHCIKNSKQTYIPAVLTNYLIVLLMVLPMKGELSLTKVLFFATIYGTQCIFIQMYENHRGFLTSCERTESLRYGGLIGIIVRIPISLLSILTPLGIYGFAISCPLDFFCRGLYYKYQSIKILKNTEIKGEI